MLNTMVITSQIKHQEFSSLWHLERSHSQYECLALNMKNEVKVWLLYKSSFQTTAGIGDHWKSLQL